jgi:arginine decarboxylase
VLGDLHNLFGDTHAVHVSLDGEGRWRIDEIVEGDTVSEVLGYVQYNVARLRKDVRAQVERAVHAGRLSVPEGRQLTKFYEDGLEGYTYLES